MSSISQELKTVRVVENKPVAQKQWAIWVKAEEGELLPFEPGQFSMLSFDGGTDPLLPRAFAIVRRQSGAYQFIYKVVGRATQRMAQLKTGDKLRLMGPLGQGIKWKNRKTTFVAGGVGYSSLMAAIDLFASQHPMPEMNLFYGVRKDIELIKEVKIQAHYCSDDGSVGYHGFLPALMKETESLWRDSEQFYICGPTGMMKAVYDLLPPEKSYYYLEEAMGCGLGICVACVVPIRQFNGEMKRVRSCLEGPVFSGAQLKAWRDVA